MNRLIKQLCIVVSLVSTLPMWAQGDRFGCDDGVCTLPDSSSPASPTFAVVSPVGYATVAPITMGPRLVTLDGKTIAVVGEDFMANVTHPEIKRLILQHYPTATVILPDELPIAGPYPAPGLTRPSVEAFRQALISRHVDAVIAGNAACGICTPKETGSCIVAEMMGIPAVLVCAPGFDVEARYTARNNGVPVLRTAIYPGAPATHTNEQLMNNTDEVTWPQILAALTTPIRPEEYASSSVQQGITDDVFSGTLEEVYAYFADMQWSDGAPFVPPVYEKVLAFMRYTDYAWDETVATLPVAYRNTTAWHVAVNGCMAGCKPEYMPILIALTKAMGDGEFRRTIASTHAWMPYCWISGPVARQLGLSYGQGLVNAEANAAIARFLNLAMMNLAGYYIGGTRMGSFGYLSPWCLVEDEPACHRVGWPTWQEQNGLGTNSNSVTCSSALMWGNNMAPSTTNPRRVMQLLAWDISERCQFALGSGKQFTHRVVMLTEPVAAILAEGYPDLGQLEDTLIEQSRRSALERTFANYYANAGGRKDDGEHTFNQYYSHILSYENAEQTPTPEWYDSPSSTMQTIATMQKGETAFLLTGDPSRNKIQTMPGGGFSTMEIELPEDWDMQMDSLGYAPLESFYLDTTIVSSSLVPVLSASRPVGNHRGTYYINGQRTSSPSTRGVYIQNGHKIVW